MAETIRKGRLVFLEQFAKLFAALLGLLGVVSGCNSAMDAPTYGPMGGLSVYGQTHSAEDSSCIWGIDVRLVSLDSLIEYDFYNVQSFPGDYTVWMAADNYPWPDSVRLIASDPDSLQDGWFIEKDTLLSISPLQEEDDHLQIQVELYLESEEGSI